MMGDPIELDEGLDGRRRRLRLRLGSIQVEVTEVPGVSLSDQELEDIRLARRSYTAMWGVDPAAMSIDPLDGRDPGPYNTTHYLAWVRDAAQGPKLVTMRKVRLDPARLEQAQLEDPAVLLPIDIRGFRVWTPDGDVPLWVALTAHARGLAPDEAHPEFRIASIGRIATFPYGEPKPTDRERERTAIAFAATQLLACHGDSSLLHVWALCPELRDQVLGIREGEDCHVVPSFRTTAEVLGLPPGAVRMDNGLDIVQEHKAAFPGYFIDNADAALVVAELLDEGHLVVKDLCPTIVHLVTAGPGSAELPALEELARLLAASDNRRLAELLTRPRLFKYLVPILAGDEPLTWMSTAELRNRVIRRSGDGPFSSTVIPAEWADSARAVLAAAARKYGGATTAGPASRRRKRVVQLAGGSGARIR
jgi:hypothetical protein